MASSANRPELRRWRGAAVAWLATCGAAVGLALLGLLSVGSERSSVEIENAYAALVVGQALFVVFVWPLFERPRSDAERDGLAGLCVRLAALFVLSLPFVILALTTRAVDVTVVVWSQALVMLMGLAAGSAIRLPSAETWYLPSAFVLSAVLPLAAYLLLEEGRVPAGWGAAVSPLWAAGAVASGGERLVPLVVFACLGAVLAAARLFAGAPAPDRA